jgi:uncharacterized protein (TIGR00251 family)
MLAAGGGSLLELVEKDGAVTLALRVQPRASRDAIEGEWNGALKLRVTAPPVDDRANEACCRLLAEHLNIPASAVRILSGERSRTKRVEVRGVTAEQVRKLAIRNS